MITTVYSLGKDLSFQYFLAADSNDIDKLWMKCQPKSTDWSIVNLYNRYPFYSRGDFFHFDLNTLIINERARDILDGFWEMSELLPVKCEDESEEYYIVNVLNCVNCLDKGKTRWKTSTWIEKYEFHLDRLPQSGLFKLPNENGASIYIVTRSNQTLNENFKALVEAEKLKGLTFFKIWEHEG